MQELFSFATYLLQINNITNATNGHGGFVIAIAITIINAEGLAVE